MPAPCKFGLTVDVPIFRSVRMRMKNISVSSIPRSALFRPTADLGMEETEIFFIRIRTDLKIGTSTVKPNLQGAGILSHRRVVDDILFRIAFFAWLPLEFVLSR